MSLDPRDIDNELGSRLVNYYLDRLDESPSLHDKVEFDIIFSCFTADLESRLEVLKKYDFSDCDLKALTQSLRELTNRIIQSKEGLWLKDFNKFDDLEERHQIIMNGDMDKISKIYWLLEDCKRYGTLPFAGLARAGFIAVQFLRSLINVGIFSNEDYNNFMNCLDTVSGRITRDFHNLDKSYFLKLYGHLRPGTYDILSPRYDEAPDLYFDWTQKSERDNDKKNFSLSEEQISSIHDLLEEHQLNDDVIGLFNFFQKSIEGREYGKFLFTRNISDALKLFRELSNDFNIDAEELSYANIDVIYNLYSSTVDSKVILLESIERGKRQYAITKSIIMPPLIRGSDDIWGFEMPVSEPNFITLNSVTANVTNHNQRDKLKDGIVMIPNADPGYDWIFSHEISGLVTAYGGVNSHMAIRASELGIPAVIGAGEILFNSWNKAEILHLDCANRRVEIIKSNGHPEELIQLYGQL